MLTLVSVCLPSPQVSGKQSDKTGTIRKHGASIRFTLVLLCFYSELLLLSHQYAQQEAELLCVCMFQVQQSSRGSPVPRGAPCWRVITRYL